MILALFLNIIPLIALILLGIYTSRIFTLDAQTLSKIVIFIASPYVIFGSVMQLEIRPEYFLLPVIFACVCTAASFSSFYFSKKVFSDKTPYLIGLATSNGNVGYFGLPIALMLFGADDLGIYLMMTSGGTLMNVTLGYFFSARSQFSAKDSLKIIAKLPTGYALVAAVALNLLGFELPDIAIEYWKYFTGVWVILGMMIIGIAMGKSDGLRLDPKLLSVLFAAKFILWPLLATLIIWADSQFFGLFDRMIYIMIFLAAITPLPGDTVSFALQFNLKPRAAALTILLSTIFALFYIPLMFFLFV